MVRAGPALTGSSPLARGLLGPHRRDRRDPRIIPARAGFTPARPTPDPAAKDHPRSRGVYALSQIAGNLLEGSSPLARGLPPQPGLPADQRRIIPARAGFTAGPSSSSATPWDHPRSRGVYYRERMIQALQTGSSPLARGLHGLLERADDLAGIIPARAGFTLLSPFPYPHAWDHPRSRGVYQGDIADTASTAGSSPLARGLRHIIGLRHILPGIIPARAGFT